MTATSELRDRARGLVLTVDRPRWSAHVHRTLTERPGTVPVLKGNGYGLGLPFLAQRVAELRPDLVAVGTDRELARLRRHHDGDALVLTPWVPGAGADDDRRVVRSVSGADDLAALVATRPCARVVLEGRTSLRRHGMTPEQLLAAPVSGATVEGLALHLPKVGDRLSQVRDWTRAVRPRQVFVSWLSRTDLHGLAAEFPDVTFRPRIGTSLWLGDRDALRASATVLEVHPVSPGDPVGYRQRRVRRHGHVLVVAGGTSHGIGMRAPFAPAGARERAAALAKGLLETTGAALSPYRLRGRRLWFVEPPHMQVSLVLVPRGGQVPVPGDRVDVDVRFTTTTFDDVCW